MPPLSVLIFLFLFVILGTSLGPLLQAVAIQALSVNRGRRLAAWTVGLGLRSIYRPAITFNPGDELTLKKRHYDEQHNTEYVVFGGLMNSVKRTLVDPQDRIHSFYGVPFGFVDELFGLVCDPRDVAVGRRLRVEQSNNRYEHRVEKDGHLRESVKAIFDFPRGHVGVRLPDVIALAGGSLDSQAIDFIRDLYEKSQNPKSSQAGLLRLLVPFGVFVGTILLWSFIDGRGGGGGGGGVPGNSSSIGPGAALLFLLVSTSPIHSVNWRDVAVGAGFAVAGLLFSAMLYLAFPVPVTMLWTTLPLGVWAVIFLGVGLTVPPFVAFWLGRSLGPFGMLLGKLYIIIGLLRWSRPVITLEKGEHGIEYVIVEYGDHDWAIEPKWYRFALTRLGVGFKNDTDIWPEGTTIDRETVVKMVDRAQPATDGGDGREPRRGTEAAGDSVVGPGEDGRGEAQEPFPAPPEHVATDQIGLEGVRGFVPEEPPEESILVRTDRTTGWMFEAGKPRRHMYSALAWAKRIYGGGKEPVGDRWVVGASLAAIVIGSLLYWVLF